MRLKINEEMSEEFKDNFPKILKDLVNIYPDFEDQLNIIPGVTTAEEVDLSGVSSYQIPEGKKLVFVHDSDPDHKFNYRGPGYYIKGESADCRGNRVFFDGVNGQGKLVRKPYNSVGVSKLYNRYGQAFLIG